MEHQDLAGYLAVAIAYRRSAVAYGGFRAVAAQE